MLEQIKEIVAIVATAIPFIIATATFIAKNSKSKKLAKLATNVNKITKEVQKYVVAAEQFLNYAGQDKKEWVKTKVNQFAIENKIEYDEKLVDNLIEEIVELTKRVNSRDKDQKEELE